MMYLMMILLIKHIDIYINVCFFMMMSLIKVLILLSNVIAVIDERLFWSIWLKGYKIINMIVIILIINRW
jgi:hypothetical protein